jgi:hypothetical protein
VAVVRMEGQVAAALKGKAWRTYRSVARVCLRGGGGGMREHPYKYGPVNLRFVFDAAYSSPRPNWLGWMQAVSNNRQDWAPLAAKAYKGPALSSFQLAKLKWEHETLVTRLRRHIANFTQVRAYRCTYPSYPLACVRATPCLCPLPWMGSHRILPSSSLGHFGRRGD